MKAKLLQKTLDTEYICHGNDEYLFVGSPYCPDLISYDRKTKKLSYRLDTRNKGRDSIKHKELEEIWDKLEDLISTNEVEIFFDGDDEVDEKVAVYIEENNKILTKYVEKGKEEYPNITLDGEIIYENSFFKNKKDCLDSVLKRIAGDILFFKKEKAKKFDEIKELDMEIKKIEEFILKYS